MVVEGKVRLRDDRVQLSCDSVRLYQPGAIPVTEPLLDAQPGEEPKVTEKTVTPAAPTESQRLVISITQTSDKEHDIAALHKLVDTLKDFSGKDEVSLYIITDGEKIDILKLPSTTGYCPELHQRLVELMGEGGIKVE
jgi:hypothetical protein